MDAGRSYLVSAVRVELANFYQSAHQAGELTSASVI